MNMQMHPYMYTYILYVYIYIYIYIYIHNHYPAKGAEDDFRKAPPSRSATSCTAERTLCVRSVGRKGNETILTRVWILHRVQTGHERAIRLTTHS